MSLDKFDYIEDDEDEEDNDKVDNQQQYPRSIKNVRQSKIDIRKSKINIRQSKLQFNGQSQMNLRQSKLTIPRSMVQLKQSTILDLGLYQANPEDIWTPQDHAESIKYINQFINATQSKFNDDNNNLQIYEQIKDYCKNRKNRQLLILNDFHLYLRDAYKEKFEMQQIILEIIYQISLEKDFCDELALLGGLIDEVFVFLQTHLKNYNNHNHYLINPKGQEKNNNNNENENNNNNNNNDVLQNHQIEIIDSSTLLKLDLWIRIAVNFCKNDEVLEYVAINKEDVIKYLLIFLQNIDNVIKTNPNLSSINCTIIASTVKTGVLEILFLLTQIDEMRSKVIFSESYFTTIYTQLLKKTQNQTIFSNLCKLISQITINKKFPIHVLGINIIEDFIFSYMMRVVYNIGLFDDSLDSSQSNWLIIKQERETRQNYLAEIGLARTFFYLTVNHHQRTLLMKSILSYEDHILFRFMYQCFQNKQFDALIYMVLGLTQLASKEQLKLTKPYHNQILMYIYQECEQIQIEKDSKEDKQKMLLTILMTRLIKFFNFNKDEIEKILELTNVKLNNTLKVPAILQQPIFEEQKLMNEMRTKKIKKYEEMDEQYKKQIMGYEIEGLLIKDRPYGDSVNYSRLISDMNEDDFQDSLFEDNIFHLRNNNNKQINDQDHEEIPLNNKKKGQIIHLIEQEKLAMFNFEKIYYDSNSNDKYNQQSNKQQSQKKFNNSFLLDQKQQVENAKGKNIRNNSFIKQNDGSNTIGIINKDHSENNNNHNNSNNIQPPSFNVSSIKNKGQNEFNNQSDDFIKDDLVFLNQNNNNNNNKNETFNLNSNSNQPNFNSNSQQNQQQQQQQSMKQIQQQYQNQEQQKQSLYLNNKKQCFLFHFHYKRKCEYCQNVFYSFFDQSNLTIEQWLYNTQTGQIDDIIEIDYFYENFIQIINSLFYFTMELQGEIPQSTLKQLSIIIANELHQYSDKRYTAAVIMLISHIVLINPSFINRLITINFFCVQDFILTQFLNCFGYKTFNLLKLIKRGTGTVNRNPIFEQVQRRGSKLSSIDEDGLNDEEKDNVYQNYVIQSTLQIEFDGIQFNTNEITLSTQQSAQFIEKNKDKEIDEPQNLKQYTDYFMQLHSIQHVLDLTYRIFKVALQKKDQLILESAPNYIEQLVYLLLFFNDINTFQQPKIPFYPQTKYWEKNKMLIQKGFLQVIHIIKLLITKKQVISEYYKNQQNNPHLLEVIKMAELFPSFKGCVLLFNIVYQIYNFKSQNNSEFLPYDLQYGLKSAATIQRTYQVQNQTFFNFDPKLLQELLRSNQAEQKLGRMLKFQILCLQFFCTFERKEILNSIKKDGYTNLNNYLQVLQPILELCKKLSQVGMKNKKNQQSIKDLELVVNGNKLKSQDQNNQQNIENQNQNQQQQYKTTGNLDSLVSDFQSSVQLFFHMLSQYRHFSDTILSHPTFHFLVQNIQNLHLSNEAQYCFTASIHSLCKTNACLDNIQRHYKDFSKDITTLLYDGKLSKHNLMPLLRSIRFLIQNRQRDSQYFREMIPKLREYAEISNEIQNMKNGIGNLEISAIGQTQKSSKSNSESNTDGDNLIFMDQKSIMNMLSQQGKLQALSFIDQDEMTFLQNMNDEDESAIQSVNESISLISKNKKISQMNQNEKKQLFKEMFQKESRLLLKLLVIISENELKEKIKDMKLNKEFKIEEAGILSKKTQKQQIDLEEKKKEIIQQPHSESSLYGYDMKVNYQDRLSYIPDYYKKSAYELYEERKIMKQKQEMRDNEPIPIVKFKDDSESTFIKIKNNQISNILDKKPEFLLDNTYNQNIQNNNNSPQKQQVQFQNQNRQSSLNQISKNDIQLRNDIHVESLQKYMKQQQEKQQQQQYNNKINVKEILPKDYSSSLSSIYAPDNNNLKNNNSQLFKDYNNNQGNKQMYNNQTSNMISNEYSVLKNAGQNILSDVDDIYKKMYRKKLNFQ